MRAALISPVILACFLMSIFSVASTLPLMEPKLGYGTQYRRIRPVIDHIIQDPALDDDARVARIREELHNLSNQPDDATIRVLRSQFPDLPTEAVAKHLTDGLDSARRNIWSGLYGYVHSSGTYPPPSHPPLWPSGGAATVTTSIRCWSRWSESRKPTSCVKPPLETCRPREFEQVFPQCKQMPQFPDRLPVGNYRPYFHDRPFAHVALVHIP
jgi:hypothetical protein